MIKIINSKNVTELTEEGQLLFQFFKSKTKMYKCYTDFPVLKGGIYNDIFKIYLCFNTNKGVFCFNQLNYANIDDISNYQDEVYSLFEISLKKIPIMVNKRNLITTINIFSLDYGAKSEECGIDNLIFNDKQKMINGLEEFLKDCPTVDDSILKKVNSGIQGAYGTISRKKRDFVPGTKSEIISNLNDCIEEYDDDQFDAIFSNGGIQRIRGMAGSGKTIILARKAAQLHFDHQDWDIIVTYSTRSQKQQLESLISNYYSKLSDGDLPNFKKIRVMHAWGSSSANGLYYEVCLCNNVAPLNFRESKIMFGKNANYFDKTCERLLSEVEEFQKLYDCILIDEAQDFKSNFFKVCLNSLRQERLVYAYDELQNLGGETMDSPKKLFGGKPILDTPLKVCYRNQKNVITTAHALGLGLYREKGLVQIPNDISVWEAIGYVSDKKLDYGKNVTLYRPLENSPNLIEIDENEVIKWECSSNLTAQMESCRDLICSEIGTNGLLSTDFMIIDLDTLNAEDNFKIFTNLLEDSCFNTHYAGGVQKDLFYKENSVVYSTIYRAKGNENFYVIILNSQQMNNSISDTSARNSLFTALTRSKGWVHILGYGEGMEQLIDELETIQKNNFALTFSPYPTKEQMKTIKKYSEDISKSEEHAIQKTKETIKKLLNDNKKDPLVVAKDLFNVQTKEELLELLGIKQDEE